MTTAVAGITSLRLPLWIQLVLFLQNFSHSTVLLDPRFILSTTRMGVFHGSTHPKITFTVIPSCTANVLVVSPTPYPAFSGVWMDRVSWGLGFLETR